MAVNFQIQPTSTAANTVIDSGSFWPQIDLSDIRAALRIDETVTHDRLYFIATAAVCHVNGQLSELRKQCAENGIEELAKWRADETLNGDSVSVFYYRAAVYQYTHATLLEKYADYSAGNTASGRAEVKQEQADDAKAQAHAAIAALIGRVSADSELI